MRSILTITVTAILVASTSANAWWGSNNNNQNNWNNYGQNSGQGSGQSSGNYDGNQDGRGNAAGDGSLGFNADFKFKMKMKGLGNNRVDGYNYGDWSNQWNGNQNSGNYYNDSSGRNYGYNPQPYYGPYNDSGNNTRQPAPQR